MCQTKKKFLKKNTKCEKYKKNVTNIETEKKKINIK